MERPSIRLSGEPLPTHPKKTRLAFLHREVNMRDEAKISRASPQVWPPVL
jgi:hypothetical protein